MLDINLLCLLIFLVFFANFGTVVSTCSGPVRVPFRSVCGDEPVCALLKCAFFCFFPNFFLLRRFEHGRFSCKGGREMADIIPTVFGGIV